MSDETLRVIHLVARHQSIITAAKQLNEVPSATSYIIRKTEESPGVELLIRKGRYIELSPAGSYFTEHSKITLGGLEALKRNTALIHDGIERELTIVVNNIIPGDLLVVFTRDFGRQFTSTILTIDLEVHNGCWGVLYSKCADLVYGILHVVPSSEGITSEPVGQTEQDFVVSLLHPLAAKRHPLENNELRYYPAVCIRDTSVNFPPMRVWLLEGQKPVFVPDFVTAIALTEQNAGIGYIPHHPALSLLNSGKLLKKPMREHKHATKSSFVARSDGIGKACQWCVEYLKNPQLMTQFVFNRQYNNKNISPALIRAPV